MSGTRRRLVDAHMHLWDSVHNNWYGFPVPGGEDVLGLALERPFPDVFLLDDYLAATSAAEVVKTVHVTACGAAEYVEAENKWIAEIARERGLPTALIGTVDVERSPSEIEATLDREMANPHYRGIRVLAGLDYATDLAEHILSALSHRGLVYDAVEHPGGAPGHGIAGLAGALRRNENLVLSLEHTGWPFTTDRETFNQWRIEMAELAKCPNANCKLSGAAMFVHRTDRDVFRRYFDTVIELFGVNRCMFGSNFPVDGIYDRFESLIAVFEGLADDLSEDEADALFCGVAERVYKI